MTMPEPASRSTTREALGLALGAGVALTILFTTQLYIWVNWWPLRVGWGTALLWALPQLAVWLAGIRVVMALARRWPIEPPHRNRAVVLHAATSVGMAIGGLLLLDGSDQLLHWSVGLGAPSSIISSVKYTIIHLHMGIGVYWVTLAVSHAVSYRVNLREHQARFDALAGELARTRLAALRSQLQPHFLFNTLNSIAVAARHDPPTAERMVHRLSDFLRRTLETAEVAEITLAEELSAVGAYLAIEQVRFGPGLKLRIEAEDNAMNCLVPTLVLQPLVENALRYAIAPRPGGGHIEIVATRIRDCLVITVRDDGPGMIDGRASQGVGLSNTRRRLETHYGTMSGFAVTSGPGGGTEARLEIPAREAGVAEETS
jgi:two-component system LytT family sensor kinase